MNFQIKKFKKKNIYKKNIIKNTIWYFVNNLLFNSLFPFSQAKILILKIFGAKIGKNVIIKEYVKIKFPSNLIIGDNVWIGEGVWIDNIAIVEIGNNCCISQNVYFCTGNHNSKLETFELIEESIVVEKNSWIASRSTIGPGVKIHEGTFVKIGSIVTKSFNQNLK